MHLAKLSRAFSKASKYKYSIPIIDQISTLSSAYETAILRFLIAFS